MAIIPGTQKIETFNQKKDTIDRTNGRNQSLNQYYTMNDIIETVNAEGGGGVPYQMYIAWVQKGLSSWSVREMHNDTGLTFDWSNTNSQTIHADVTGGTLIDYSNNIYTWGTFESPGIITGSDVELRGVFVQSSQLDVREVRIQSDGSGLTYESSFSGFLTLKRMIVTDPIIYGS